MPWGFTFNPVSGLFDGVTGIDIYTANLSHGTLAFPDRESNPGRGGESAES